MILYNVTIKIEVDSHDKWLDWMKKKHIPDVLQTDCFLSCRMSRILAQNEEDGITYSIQYLAASMKDFHRYQAHFAPKLQQDLHQQFADKYVVFRTMMELIEEFFAPSESS